MMDSFKTDSELIQCSNSNAMIEKSDIIHNGKTFEGMGSYLMPNKKGLMDGILYCIGDIKKLSQYRNLNTGFVGSWDSSFKVKAYFLNEWVSNFGDTRQLVYFMINGKPFYGIYYKTNSDIIRVKELKTKPEIFLNFVFEEAQK